MAQNEIKPIPYEFDVSGIDPFVGGGAPLPTGSYPAQIISMEVKANSGNTGHNLALVYEVTAGEFKGRKFFDNLNLWYKGPDEGKTKQTVEIANRHLASIGHAVGVTAGKDLTQLCLRPMLVELELHTQPARQNPNTGEEMPARESNRINRRDPLSEQSTTPTPPFQQQQQAQQAQSAPAFNPAAQQPAAQQSAPPFNPGAQAATPPAQQPAAAAAPAGAGAPPPWQK